VDLSEARVDVDRAAEPRGDDLRGLARPAEVARVDRGHLLPRELVRERPRLLAAAVVQGRVSVALPASAAVPIRLAVADEDERRHGQ
jgi:hypothetical protein